MQSTKTKLLSRAALTLGVLALTAPAGYT